MASVRVLPADDAEVQKLLARWAMRVLSSRELGVSRWWFSRTIWPCEPGEALAVSWLLAQDVPVLRPGLRDKRACTLAPVGSGTIPPG
jgi:hypothetical protein